MIKQLIYYNIINYCLNNIFNNIIRNLAVSNNIKLRLKDGFYSYIEMHILDEFYAFNDVVVVNINDGILELKYDTLSVNSELVNTTYMDYITNDSIYYIDGNPWCDCELHNGNICIKKCDIDFLYVSNF